LQLSVPELKGSREMNLTIIADSGATLEELVSASELDREALAPVVRPVREMRSHAAVIYEAAIPALGGLSILFQRLERLARYCVDKGKSIKVEVSAFGVTVSAEWQRQKPGS
jgi:hypothetical protein